MHTGMHKYTYTDTVADQGGLIRPWPHKRLGNKVCSRLLSVQKLREEKRYQRQLYTIVLHHFKQRRQVYTGTDWSQLHVLQSADYAKNTRSTATYKNSSNGIVRHDHWRYKLRGSEVQRECV